MESITIGKVTKEWQYVVGTYQVEILQAEKLNPLEKVVCGLLSCMHGAITKERIGVAMGFNVIDKPEIHKYKDEAESSILDHAFSTMTEEGLIALSADGIQLTATGTQAVEEGVKHKRSVEIVDLYFDMSSGNDIVAKKLFEDDLGEVIELNYNIDDERVRLAIESQRPDLSDIEKRKTVGHVACLSSTPRSNSVSFDVVLSISDGQVELKCGESEELAQIVQKDKVLSNHLLADFFQSVQESIVNKSPLQEEVELSASNKDADIAYEGIACSKDEIVLNLLRHEKLTMSVACFFLDELTDIQKQTLGKFAAKNKATMVCVEFVDGDDNYADYCLKNLVYKKVEHLTTNEACVLGDGTYFGDELFVLEYDGKEYQIPLVVYHPQKKYKTFVLAKPFASKGVIEMSNVFTRDLQRPRSSAPSIEITDNRYTNLMSLKACFYDNMPQEVKDTFDNLADEWVGYLKYEKSELLKDTQVALLSPSQDKANSAKEKLSRFRNVYQKYNEDIADIDEMLREGFKVKPPTTVSQHAYIIDTNVFLFDPDCLEGYNWETDAVFVPLVIYEELDDKSHGKDDNAQNARIALDNINRIAQIRPQFRPREPVTEEEMKHYLKGGYNLSSHDNTMLTLALRLKDQEKYEGVTIISSDDKFAPKARDRGIDVTSIR